MTQRGAGSVCIYGRRRADDHTNEAPLIRSQAEDHAACGCIERPAMRNIANRADRSGLGLSATWRRGGRASEPPPLALAQHPLAERRGSSSPLRYEDLRPSTSQSSNPRASCKRRGRYLRGQGPWPPSPESSTPSPHRARAKARRQRVQLHPRVHLAWPGIGRMNGFSTPGNADYVKFRGGRDALGPVFPLFAPCDCRGHLQPGYARAERHRGVPGV
jgi:hypothetical protein